MSQQIDPLNADPKNIFARSQRTYLMSAGKEFNLAAFQAIAHVLCYSRGGFSHDLRSWTIAINSPHYQHEVILSGNTKQWHVSSLDSETPTYIAALMDAFTIDGAKESWNLREQWQTFVRQLRRLPDCDVAITSVALDKFICQYASLLDMLVELCSSLYNHFIERTFNHGIKVIHQLTPEKLLIDQNFERIILLLTPVATHHGSTIVKQLQRRLRNGVTALLVGPTGVGKTEAVKRATLQAEALLIKIAGHPGLDDRQLFGGTYPKSNGESGFQFVEGALSEAWRCAATQRVVLLIDELLRMDGYYHAVLIGALDKLSGREIKARPRFKASALTNIKDNALYYALVLPNGDVLIAPAQNLSVICTTNLGYDYVQASTDLDPALLGRFELICEVEPLPIETAIRIVWRQGVPMAVAYLIAAFGQFTSQNIATNGGLLKHEANIRILSNWAKESLSLNHELKNWQQSLTQSCQDTLVPFVCPRLSNGQLDQQAVELVKKELTTILGELKL